MKKRIPAKSINDIGCEVSTPKSPYPIFTQGKALPHKAEQNIAKIAAIQVFVKISAFILTSLYAQNKRCIFGTNAQTHRYIFYHSERTRSILFFLIFRQRCGFRCGTHSTIRNVIC